MANFNMAVLIGWLTASALCAGVSAWNIPSGSAGSCMMWAKVESNGWTCGGTWSSSCSCPSNYAQHVCEYSGTKYYSCKATAGPDPGKAATCACPSAYPFCYASNQWCYASSTSNSYSKTVCAKTCTDNAPAKSAASSAISSGSCNPSKVGKFIADFAKNRKGQKVTSALQPRSTQCWDLARRAMEEAIKAGYKIDFMPLSSPYIWSKTEVAIEHAQPGDIAQFQGWQERYRFAGNPHTAVVTGCYDAADGSLLTYQQNPSPVEAAKYHPPKKISGHVKIFRITERNSRLRLFESIGLHFQSSSGAAIGVFGMGVIGVGAISFFAVAYKIARRHRGIGQEGYGEIDVEDAAESILLPEVQKPADE